MYSQITLNNTDRKEIGISILKKTDKMITDFDLDYERFYKVDNSVSQRELEFQQFLKKQEQYQFYLKNLIKILRIYYKQYNYNSETYFLEYKSHKNRGKNKILKKTKSLNIQNNKTIYNKILKNSKMYQLFKPWVYPLGNRDRKIFLFKEIYTERDINLKGRPVRMTQNEVKKYVEIFGVVPVNFIKKDEKDKKKKISNKKKLISSYNFLRNNYDAKSYDNKTHLLLQKGMKIKEKFFGGFEMLKKYVYMKNKNKTSTSNLKLKSKERRSISANVSNIRLYKKNNSMNNIFYNKDGYNNCFTFNKKRNEIDKNIYRNNRYLNLKKSVHTINKNFYTKLNNNNLTSLNSLSSLNNIPFTRNRYSNQLDLKSMNIRLKQKINHENIFNFKSDCSDTIKKSELLSKDINFLNKVLAKTKNNYKQVSKILRDTNIDDYNILKMVKNDIFEQRRKKLAKFKYVKENMSGNLKINFKDFIRKPLSKLDYVNVYNKKRELFNCFKNDSEISDKSDDEKVNIFSDIKKNHKCAKCDRCLSKQKNKVRISLIIKKKFK